MIHKNNCVVIQRRLNFKNIKATIVLFCFIYWISLGQTQFTSNNDRLAVRQVAIVSMPEYKYK